MSIPKNVDDRTIFAVILLNRIAVMLVVPVHRYGYNCPLYWILNLIQHYHIPPVRLVFHLAIMFDLVPSVISFILLLAILILIYLNPFLYLYHINPFRLHAIIVLVHNWMQFVSFYWNHVLVHWSKIRWIAEENTQILKIFFLNLILPDILEYVYNISYNQKD